MRAIYVLRTKTGKKVRYEAPVTDPIWIIKLMAHRELGIEVEDIIDEIPIDGTIQDIVIAVSEIEEPHAVEPLLRALPKPA